MNDRNTSRGINPALLLLIPAAVIFAKGVRHRREMWASGWTPSGATGHGHGHRAPFGVDGEAADRSFRLPPKIEWILDTWHTRAHEKTESTGPGAETI
jgi:hypothetical protein